MKVSDISPLGRLSLLFSRAQGETADLGVLCAACGTGHPLHLVRRERVLLCQACAAREAGRTGVEIHHLGGRFEREYTVEVNSNDHAVLTALQNCWWRNRHDPGSAYAVGFDVGAWLVLCGGEP